MMDLFAEQALVARSAVILYPTLIVTPLKTGKKVS